jgi:hypothetical protein
VQSSKPPEEKRKWMNDWPIGKSCKEQEISAAGTLSIPASVLQDTTDKILE